MNSPTVFSWPHFYQADESLLEYALGVNPEKEKHETYLELEPVSKPIKILLTFIFNINLDDWNSSQRK